MQGFLAEVLSKYRGSGEAAGRGGRVYVIAALVQLGAASLVLTPHVLCWSVSMLHVCMYCSCPTRSRYALFESVFESLPIATVVDEKIFVMHGGLFRRKGVRLSHIAAVKRRRSIPVRSTSFEDSVFEDLMWSDPRPITGSQQSDRGAGVFWGSDITHQFCKLNGIEFIVRSHECVPNGFVLGVLHSPTAATSSQDRGSHRTNA